MDFGLQFLEDHYHMSEKVAAKNGLLSTVMDENEKFIGFMNGLFAPEGGDGNV